MFLQVVFEMDHPFIPVAFRKTYHLLKKLTTIECFILLMCFFLVKIRHKMPQRANHKKQRIFFQLYFVFVAALPSWTPARIAQLSAGVVRCCPAYFSPCRRGDRCAPYMRRQSDARRNSSKKTAKASSLLVKGVGDMPAQRAETRSSQLARACRLVFCGYVASLARLASVADVSKGGGEFGELHAVRTSVEPSLSPQRTAAMNVPKSGYRVFSANSSVASTELAKKITE